MGTWCKTYALSRAWIETCVSLNRYLPGPLAVDFRTERTSKRCKTLRQVYDAPFYTSSWIYDIVQQSLTKATESLMVPCLLCRDS